MNSLYPVVLLQGFLMSVYPHFHEGKLQWESRIFILTPKSLVVRMRSWTFLEKVDTELSYTKSLFILQRALIP
jgi:hypothetical protein